MVKQANGTTVTVNAAQFNSLDRAYSMLNAGLGFQESGMDDGCGDGLVVLDEARTLFCGVLCELRDAAPIGFGNEETED